MALNDQGRPQGGKVLLYSGGMDSMILDYLHKPDVLLYIDIGGRYTDKELAALRRTGADASERLEIVSLPLGRFERPDLKVPCRNAIFALVASIYGDTVYLGATAGDRTADKSPEYAKAMGGLFDVIWQKQVWTPKRKVRVVMPLRKWTKTQCVREYLRQGGQEARLVAAPSCYDAEAGHCGACNPCMRKWVAFKNNGLAVGFFKQDPQPMLLAAWCKGVRRGKQEDKETMEALGIK